MHELFDLSSGDTAQVGHHDRGPQDKQSGLSGRQHPAGQQSCFRPGRRAQTLQRTSDCRGAWTAKMITLFTLCRNEARLIDAVTICTLRIP
jgi:hypothetical protein